MIDKYLTADIVDNEVLSGDIQENEEVKSEMPEIIVVEGGGGSVETVTFSIMEDGPFSMWGGGLIYVNSKGQFVSTDSQGYTGVVFQDIPKNSLIIISGHNLYGDIEEYFSGTLISPLKAYVARGNFYAIANM